jgi:hypothetical protein
LEKTVKQYKTALEEEIHRWDGFARALRKDHLEAFEELIDMCRSYILEGADSPSSRVFEPMAISIVLAQQERISILERELAAIKPKKVETPAMPEPPMTIPQEPKIHFRKAKAGGEQTRLA